jgi:hypothetical protein
MAAARSSSWSTVPQSLGCLLEVKIIAWVAW